MAIDCEALLLYSAAVILGFCCLFAYNSFLSSPSYLEHYFQFAAVKYTDDVSTLPEAKTPVFWNQISTWVTVLMIVPMFLMQFIILTPWVLRQSIQARMIIGASFSLVSVLLVPTCATGGVSENGAMAVLIIACLLCGAATTVLESALFTFFGSLPTKYMTGFVLGGGFSGSINSVLRIVITVGLPPTFSGVKTSAVIFFAIGMALMVVTIAIVLLMRLSPLVRAYISDYRRPGDVARSAHVEDAEKMHLQELARDAENDGNQAQTPMTADEMLAATTGIEKANQNALALHQGAAEVAVGSNTEPAEEGSDSNHPLSPRDSAAPSAEEEGEPHLFAVIHKIWVMMACLTATMFTTLMLFPGIGLNAMHKDAVKKVTSTKDEKTWGAEAIMPMVVILMYNAGDTIGRLSSNFPILWVSRFWVPFIVVIRAIACVIPLALGLCTPRVINSDVNPIIVFLVLGITNGYLVGLTMAYGSSDQRLTPKERNIAGACMCLALLIGTTSGSVLSLIVVTQAL